MSKDGRAESGLLLGGMVAAFLLLVAASRARRPSPTPAGLTNILTGLYGPPGAGLTWADLAWVPGCEQNIPLPSQAANLKSLIGSAIVPLVNLAHLQVTIPMGGGFLLPGIAAQLPKTCPLPGHGDGTAIDFAVADLAPSAAFERLGRLGRFSRAVQTQTHVHVELNPGGSVGNLMLVQLPNGELRRVLR